MPHLAAPAGLPPPCANSMSAGGRAHQSPRPPPPPRPTRPQLREVPQVRSDWVGIIDEWATRFLEEMDYRLEADNTRQFQRGEPAGKGPAEPAAVATAGASEPAAADGAARRSMGSRQQQAAMQGHARRGSCHAPALQAALAALPALPGPPPFQRPCPFAQHGAPCTPPPPASAPCLLQTWAAWPALSSPMSSRPAAAATCWWSAGWRVSAPSLALKPSCWWRGLHRLARALSNSGHPLQRCWKSACLPRHGCGRPRPRHTCAPLQASG